MSDKPTSTVDMHWQRRRRTANPLAPDRAVRQGEITRIAFKALGRDEAIAFLNTENARLGGRPIALATESAAGQLHVEAELRRMQQPQAVEG